jgi:hypothetical protein
MINTTCALHRRPAKVLFRDRTSSDRSSYNSTFLIANPFMPL